jgi:hypothetical protein
VFLTEARAATAAGCGSRAAQLRSVPRGAQPRARRALERRHQPTPAADASAYATARVSASATHAARATSAATPRISWRAAEPSACAGGQPSDADGAHAAVEQAERGAADDARRRCREGEEQSERRG